MKVTAPDGVSWSVKRRLTPWRDYLASSQAGLRPTTAQEWNTRGAVGLHGQQAGTGDLQSLTTIVRAIVLVIAMPIILAVKLVTFRSWWIEVKRNGRLRHEEKAGSWGPSGRRIRELANELETGDSRSLTAPPDLKR